MEFGGGFDKDLPLDCFKSKYNSKSMRSKSESLRTKSKCSKTVHK